MSDFLKEWDQARSIALDLNRAIWMYAGVFDDSPRLCRRETDTFGRLLARTMHPSFMSGPIPPKYDPERDQ